MSVSNFDILKKKNWSKFELELIARYFGGKHKEWNKATLASVRSSLRAYLLRVQKYACAYCRRQLSHEMGRNEIDHVIAKALTGMGRFTYEHTNLVAVCKRCNWHKRDAIVLAKSLAVSDSYPLLQDDYYWVHPYIHKYSEHINIIDGFVFQAVGSVANKRRAMAVINTCKLSELAVVEGRRLFEIARHAVDEHEAILRVISTSKGVPSMEVAKIIKRARPSLRQKSTDDIEQLIILTRDGASEAYVKAARRLGI